MCVESAIDLQHGEIKTGIQIQFTPPLAVRTFGEELAEFTSARFPGQWNCRFSSCDNRSLSIIESQFSSFAIVVIRTLAGTPPGHVPEFSTDRMTSGVGVFLVLPIKFPQTISDHESLCLIAAADCHSALSRRRKRLRLQAWIRWRPPEDQAARSLKTQPDLRCCFPIQMLGADSPVTH